MTRRFGSKTVSKAHNRTALLSVITMRDRLDTIDVASLARSYGVKPEVVAEMVQKETTRRSQS